MSFFLRSGCPRCRLTFRALLGVDVVANDMVLGLGVDVMLAYHFFWTWEPFSKGLLLVLVDLAA